MAHDVKRGASVAGLLIYSLFALASSLAMAEGYMNADGHPRPTSQKVQELAGWSRIFFFQARDSRVRPLEPEEQHYFQMNPGCERVWPEGEKDLDHAAFQRCIWQRYQP